MAILKSHGIYAVLLTTAFNFFSHGTLELYPTFLQVQHGFSPHEVGLIAVIYNIGAIIGGISFGALSERFGRRRIIIITARYFRSPIASAVGVCQRYRVARGRRVPDAGDGPGCVGRDTGPFERAVAGPRARDVSGIRVSARQPHRVRQRDAASRYSSALRRQLCPRARGRCGHGLRLRS
jgi:hypothetical protein